MAFRLKPGKDVVDEVVRVLDAQLAKAAEVAGKGKGSTSARAHQARVACKKARAALALLAANESTRIAREDSRVQDAARALAAMREPAALRETLRALHRMHVAGQTAETFKLAQALLLVPQLAPNPARAAQAFRRFARRIERTRKSVARLRPAKSGTAIVLRGFEETYRRARRAYRAACAEPVAENFHRWRKSAKFHAYHCQLFSAAWPPLMEQWTGELSRLAALLGEEHDLAMLHDRLQGRAAKSPRAGELPALLAAIATRRAALQPEALAIGRRAFAEKPAALRRRLSAWWQAARDAS